MKKYKFVINGNNYDAEILSVEEQVISLELNGTPYAVTVDKELKAPTQAPVKRPATPAANPVAAPAAASPAPSGAAAFDVLSPLPGTILDVYVRVGDSVQAGQKLLMLEAMKMENNVDAEKAGVVREIKINKGDAVMEGDVLIVMG